jgi:hypothetical protein
MFQYHETKTNDASYMIHLMLMLIVTHNSLHIRTLQDEEQRTVNQDEGKIMPYCW